MAYREPRLVLLLLDNLVTTLGASFTLVALPFLVMRLSGKAWDLGVTAAIEALPSLCFLLFAPRLLDRLNPLRVLRLCRVLFVVINAAICGLTWLDLMSTRIIYVTAMLGGTVWAIAFPAGRAVFSLYVRKGLVSAGNAMLAFISGLATVTLPLAAGSLILATQGNQGLAIAFGVDAACVALSLPLLVAVGRRGIIRHQRSSVTSRDKATTDTASRIPRSFHAYVLASSILVFGPIQILLPMILVARHDGRYLLIYMAQFSGIAVATAWATGVGRSMPQVVWRMLVCWSVAALAYALLSSTDGLLAVLVAFFLLAGASNTHGIQAQSWLQVASPAQEVGREMTWYSAATLGATPVAALLTGAMVDTLTLAGTAFALAACVAVSILLGGLYVRHRSGQRHAARMATVDAD